MGVARFTPAAILSLKLPLSISLNSWRSFSPNQRSCSPSPLASSTSSLVVLASSFPSLQTPTLFSERAHHPSSTHALTISIHSPLPSEPLFPSILTSPSVPLFSFSPSILHHSLLSLFLSRSFLNQICKFKLT